MKKIRYANFRSNYSPFSNPELKDEVAAYGFEESSLLQANVVVCRCLKNARIAAAIFPFKKILVWTHEPRFDNTAENSTTGILGKKIHVFNVFTGNVFFHNSHFFGSYHYDYTIDLGITPEHLECAEKLVDQARFRERRCFFGAFTKKGAPDFDFRVGESDNLDLNHLRQALIQEAIELGIGEVAGHGWGDLALEDSSFQGSDEAPWWTRKIELLARYNFSIAMENTVAPYYVTEKLWQSIKAVSLPVYVGKGSSIYETFPPDSFLDYSEYDSNQALLSEIRSMSYVEWCQRMNRCIEVYNAEVDAWPASPTFRLREVMERICREISGPTRAA